MPSHPHPCNFRLARRFDRGWGEIAFEYRWDSTSGYKDADGLANPDLAHCFLYELTRYEVREGTEREGFFFPPDPPFVRWKFRNPTDGRTEPVGLERFAATQGWAWDRHKLPGRLILPAHSAAVYRILSRQEYRFHCELCGEDAVVPGSDAGPHAIVRTFDLSGTAESGSIWRYEIVKHGICAWMEWAAEGYVADSASLGFGPW
jgi:hypothetical protein